MAGDGSGAVLPDGVAPRVLEPDLELLRQEYVLIQAWKKTASYIRYHNWYADTLELDWTTINLPNFIQEVAEHLEKPDQWESDALRMVPAPKPQRWHVSSESRAWEPVEKGPDATPLRPLAHVSMRDQVVSTALMLCLANQVETTQGDPACSLEDTQCRKRVISYGNRLFCDTRGGELLHRWGSTKLYRSYFQDYQSFITRPSLVAKRIVAERIRKEIGQRIFIVESDLDRFYDRVRPSDLMSALRRLDSCGHAFLDFANNVLDWRWHRQDADDASSYAQRNGIGGFDRVSLPQGLVSAGFFANIVLISFDEVLCNSIGNEIAPGIFLHDACRYVDDMRFVVTTDYDAEECKAQVTNWLQTLLQASTYHLRLSDKSKTILAEFGGSERPIVRQINRMRRIQAGVSGGFDAVTGVDILDAVQGLMRSQEALSQDSAGGGWQYTPVPDVRVDTVRRFAAARFRTTYRSIRPLLEASEPNITADEVGQGVDLSTTRAPAGTQQAIDDNARTFALSLIDRWIEDPSNVRLLRIGFDIWPDAEVLRAVLTLIKPFTETGGRRREARRVAWYCLAELLRAGATETGLVEDGECLPAGLDVHKFRTTLRDEAVRLVRFSARTIPWYLQQQAWLFLLQGVSPVDVDCV